jgi:hypothetical protein
VANCVWWIAGVTGLDNGLTIYSDNIQDSIEAPHGEISAIPRYDREDTCIKRKSDCNITEIIVEIGSMAVIVPILGT